MRFLSFLFNSTAASIDFLQKEPEGYALPALSQVMGIFLNYHVKVLALLYVYPEKITFGFQYM